MSKISKIDRKELRIVGKRLIKISKKNKKWITVILDMDIIIKTLKSIRKNLLKEPNR